MSQIYSTFSNPSGDLAALQSEFEELFNFFNRAEIKRKVDFKFSLNPTVGKITSDLIAGQKNIRLFHFSGHSNGSGMNFTGEDFNAEHIQKFFNTINERADKHQIDCVFINGCSNEEVVKLLSHVPVVIGTKSKIQDAYAQKFSLDFFSALIEAENTYQEAFDIAAKAQPGLSAGIQVRGEDGGVSTTGSLNDYFLLPRSDRDSGRKFPFRREVNWTRNLVILFALVAVVLLYMFRDPVIRLFRGYSCDPIETVADKCNFVIADFSYPPSEIDNFNRWLYNNVSTSDKIKEYLNAINIESFSHIIHNNAVHRDSMPRLCGYDFNLTGSFTRNGNVYQAEFNIYPFDMVRPHEPGVFTYQVSSLSSLDTLITYQTSDEANQFVLFQMCAACAEQRNNAAIAGVMSKMLADYPDTLQQSESFQLLNFQLSEIALSVQDTPLAVKSLSIVTKTGRNDLVLAAYEKMIGIHEKRGEIERTYAVMTDYLGQLELRQDTSAIFIRNNSTREYHVAAKGIREERAILVVKNPILKERFKAEAINDLEYLDRVDPGPSRYDDQIKILKKEVAVTSEFGPTTSRELGHLVQPTDEILSEDISVVLIVYKVTTKRYDRILSQLKQAEYRVDRNQSRISESPLGIKQKPTVVYHHQSLKDVAFTLAQKMRSWTDVQFDIEFQDPARMSPAPTSSMILIYWPAG